MNAIVAVCEDWGIGHKGRLLVRNSEDMAHFVRHTRGATVVMGRKTLESFPGGKPLKGRRNIVLTRSRGYAPEGVEVAHSVDEVLELCAGDDPESVWCIGGASVYEQLLPHCGRAIVTKHACTRPADSFFPNLDADPAWHVESVAEGGVTEEGIPYSFVTYVRA